MGTHSRVGCHRVNRVDGFFAEHGYLRVPSLVQWMATLQCGLSCQHCLAVSDESGFADMPVERVRGLIDESAQMGVGEFLLTGGEPLARGDLAEVIEYLGRRRVNWSLNTAAMPGEHLRKAISRNKPGFIAVSLDGPRAVHDGFRGKGGAYDAAMEAIRFFKSLEGVRVCAGTTVTSRNYDSLDETFHLVAASGVDRWGIHLLVPEGRAADRPDLFLSRGQLRQLIKFVARKRRYFPVEMADEIGYLGSLEPLVRSAPLNCGAGRAQCVVLPDGYVVPCTTLDRSCSAGNVHERSLAQVWAEGFADLRAWKPSGKCGHCEYSPACRGGCWLQRKAGTQCFKEVWHVPGALKTAAGIAICLGGLAVQEDGDGATATAGTIPVAQAISVSRVAAATSVTLDAAILGLYADRVTGYTTALPSGVDWTDPGWRFFKDFKEGTLPQDLSEGCAAIRGALETQERSLSLIALLWRALNELSPTPGDPGPSGPVIRGSLVQAAGEAGEYSQADRQAIRDTLAAIRQKAEQWRLEIFEQSLDPFLTNGRQTAPSPGPSTKGGGPSYRYDQKYYLSKDLNEERWGRASNPETREAAQAYLLAHRYADQMDLTFTISTGRVRTVVAAGDANTPSSSIVLGNSGSVTIGVFDTITTSGNMVLSFEIKGTVRVAPVASSYYPNDEYLLNDQNGEHDLSTVLQVALPGGREYTYAELLDIVYERQRDTLLTIAYEWLWANNAVLLWEQSTPVLAAVHQNGALLWPAIREIAQSDIILPTQGSGSILRETLPQTAVNEINRRAVMKDADFRMF